MVVRDDIKVFGDILKKGFDDSAVITSIPSETSMLSRDGEAGSEITLSIVIPMYNEEKSIGNVLAKVPRLPGSEIIVVDDGSVDRSAEVVASIPDVRLIKNDRNRGYGYTLLNGLRHARGKIIVHLDSDGQHEPRDIPRMIEPILNGEADLVVGSRYKGKYSYKLPLSTRIGEAFVEIILLGLFKISVRANQGGFRAFRRSVMDQVFGDIKYPGFVFATETLIRSQLYNLRVKEVPIHLYPRAHGKSRIKLMKLFISILKCSAFYYLIKRVGEAWTYRLCSFLRKIGLKYILDKY